MVDHINQHPQSGEVIHAILAHFAESTTENSSKKRKLCLDVPESSQLVASIADLSFINPRKKLDLQVFSTGLCIAKDGKTELFIPFSNLKAVLCLPTPAKTKPHSTFVLFTETQAEFDGIMFGVDDSQQVKLTESGTTSSINKAQLISFLNRATKLPVQTPSKNSFYSASSQQSKGLYQYHISGYHKAKDSFLYLLPAGLFLGFRKPSRYIPLDRITNLSVDCITSRTFNMQIESGETTVEFNMVDAAEYPSIMEYIKKSKSEWQTDTKTGKIGVAVKEEEMEQVEQGIQEDSDSNDESFGEEHFSNESSVSLPFSYSNLYC